MTEVNSQVNVKRKGEIYYIEVSAGILLHRLTLTREELEQIVEMGRDLLGKEDTSKEV